MCVLQELFFYYRPGARRAHQSGRKVVWGVGQARGMGPVGVWLRPLPPALSPEQADELMCELHQWGRANSLLFLQVRYRDRPEKLGMLLREGEEEEEEEEGRMQGGHGEVPEYVPVLELRRWLVAKSEVIARVYADTA
ncbi:hypothetical protein B484DRAFT_397528 [Ochromonadaceae sp. CCMP2298]|nr:hypothetical protein B484DRAFT_397528 [Ochromonadaceae sp. CCMP2298]